MLGDGKKSCGEPFIPTERIKKEKSRGAVVGLFYRGAPSMKWVTLEEALLMAEGIGAVHSLSGRNSGSGFLRDALELGMIPRWFVSMNNLDPRALVELPELAGRTKNSTGWTTRHRFRYVRRPQDPVFYIDPERKMFEKDSLAVLLSYWRQHNHTKSNAARGLLTPPAAEEGI